MVSLVYAFSWMVTPVVTTDTRPPFPLLDWAAESGPGTPSSPLSAQGCCTTDHDQKPTSRREPRGAL